MGRSHNEDYNVLGCILGSPYYGKLPFVVPKTIFANMRSLSPDLTSAGPGARLMSFAWLP